MAPKAILSKRASAQADKEAEAILKGISTMCSDADETELNYVIGRLKTNKNLLQRFCLKCPGPFNAIFCSVTSISS